MKGTDLELMLDSGAYTAWKKGIKIKLQDYIDFILRTRGKDTWTVVANLDVIPGKPNETPTPAEAERAADEGWDNFLQLRDALAPHGIMPVHTFHRGDDFKWLKRLVDECEFIGLGPKTDGTTEVRAAWLDECMPYVTDANGYPTHRLHGFGIGVPELIRRYPWHSIDSASWLFASAPRSHPDFPKGGCLIPGYGKVEFCEQPPKGTKHFERMSRLDREAIARYLADHGIPDPRMLHDDYCLTCGTQWGWKGCCANMEINHALYRRDEINIDYYLDIDAEEMRPWKKGSWS